MKSISTITILALSTLILWSCSGNSSEEKPVEEETAVSCFYKYNPGSTTLEWESYKFTEKKGVKGTFKDMTVEGTLESDDPVALLSSLSIKINTGSVETQDEGRNAKIVEHFFGTIKTPEITGKVKSLGEDGKATFSFVMGGMTKDVVGDYTWENNVFTYDAVIDVANWNATIGIDALNKICKDLHTGTDGKSKLWSEVRIAFSTTLTSDCE